MVFVALCLDWQVPVAGCELDALTLSRIVATPNQRGAGLGQGVHAPLEVLNTPFGGLHRYRFAAGYKG
jgi:hypothetical protein